MFKRSTIIAAVSALMLGVSALPVGAAHANPFLGRWRSVDVDASHQSLTFSQREDPVFDPFDTVEVELFDSNASAACVEGGPAVLEGEVSHNESLLIGRIIVTFDSIVCRRGDPAVSLPIDVGFVHDRTTDTLTDDFGVIWHRLGRPFRGGKFPGNSR